MTKCFDMQKFVVVGAGSAGMGVVGMTALGMMKHVSKCLLSCEKTVCKIYIAVNLFEYLGVSFPVNAELWLVIASPLSSHSL